MDKLIEMYLKIFKLKLLYEKSATFQAYETLLENINNKTSNMYPHRITLFESNVMNSFIDCNFTLLL